ncbi:MAG: hypothetical protein R2749_29190 [Acidimicrobiales bacterium]
MTETRTPIDPAAGTGLDADDVRRIEQAQRIEAIRRRRNGVQAGRVVPPGPRTGGASTVTLPPIDLGRPELPTTEVPALGEPLVSKAAGGAPVTPSAWPAAKRTGRGADRPGTGATAAAPQPAAARPHPAQGGRLAATAIGTAGMFGLVAMMGFMGRGAAEATEALPAPAPTPVVVVAPGTHRRHQRRRGRHRGRHRHRRHDVRRHHHRGRRSGRHRGAGARRPGRAQRPAADHPGPRPGRSAGAGRPDERQPLR